MQTMMVEAIKWVLKLVDANVTPRAARGAEADHRFASDGVRVLL